MTMNVGLEAIIEPKVDKRKADREADKLKEKFGAAEELEPTADTGQIEDQLNDVEFMPQMEGVGGADYTPSTTASRSRAAPRGAAGTGGPAAGGIGAGDAYVAHRGAQVAGGAGGAAGGGALSSVLKSGAMKVTLVGAVAFGMLKGINKIASAAPAWQQTTSIISDAMKLFFRPIGRLLANTFRPFALSMMEMSLQFNKITSEDGLVVGIGWLAEESLTALSDWMVETAGLDSFFGDGEASTGEKAGAAVGATTGAAAGGALGFMMGGPLGAAIGMGVGGVAGGFLGKKGGKMLEEIEWPSLHPVDIIDAIDWPDIKPTDLLDTITWPILGSSALLAKITWPTVTSSGITDKVGWPTLGVGDVVSSINWPTITTHDVLSALGLGGGGGGSSGGRSGGRSSGGSSGGGGGGGSVIDKGVDAIKKGGEWVLTGGALGAGRAEGGVVSQPGIHPLAEKEPEVVVPFSKLAEFTAHLASGEAPTGVIPDASKVPVPEGASPGIGGLATPMPNVGSSDTDIEANTPGVGGLKAPVPKGNKYDTETKLASGGVVTSPTQALVGEAGPEAVLPLSELKSIIQSAVQAGSQSTQAGGVEVDDDGIKERLDDLLREMKRSDGDIELTVDGEKLAEANRRSNERFNDARVVSR